MLHYNFVAFTSHLPPVLLSFLWHFLQSLVSSITHATSTTAELRANIPRNWAGTDLTYDAGLDLTLSWIQVWQR